MKRSIPFVLTVMALLCSPHGRAAIVTTTADSGPGSLRQAIASAAPGETITFAVSGVITLTSGELLIDRALTILGPGASNLMIQRSLAPGTPDFRIFNVQVGTVTISGLSVSHGRSNVGGGILNGPQAMATFHDLIISRNSATEAGGGLYNDGTLTLDDIVLTDNSAQGAGGTGAFGGGIENVGILNAMNRCILRGNSATGGPGDGDGFGGAIDNSGTITAMDRCILQGNSATGGPVNGGGFGGAINNSGTITLSLSLILSNSVTGGSVGGNGGGINNSGTATLTDSTVSGNSVLAGAGNTGGLAQGGGLYNDIGTVTVIRSTISANAATGGRSTAGPGGAGQGGGVANEAGTVTFDNSTLSGNTARGGAGTTTGPSVGGGIYNDLGAATFTHSTVTANRTGEGFGQPGGGLFNSFGFATLKNTIVAGNTANFDLFNGEQGDIVSGGFNRIGSTNATIAPGPGDQFNIATGQLKLGPLQDNGGPTFTHALLCGSPAIDVGDNTDAPATDQRGFPRIVGGVIDIGAYEDHNTAPMVVCPTPTTLEADASGGLVATVSVQVADADGDALVVVLSVEGSAVQTNLVNAGGPPTSATVNFTATFRSGPHSILLRVIDSKECVATCSTAVLVTSVSTQGCELYPIALHEKSLTGVPIGGVINDIYNGTKPGNFGWLTWAGSPSEPTLVRSLTPPGNSGTYSNPGDPDDHTVSVGDWVQGKPGVSNGSQVRDALDVLKQMDITVPVWNQAVGTGNNGLYRVAAFARVRLVSYHLPRENRISARFLGFVSCD